MIDYKLFEEVLRIDSTSGRERKLAEFLLRYLEAPSKEAFELGDGTLNVLFKWGSTPKVVFCSHLDTVPPYIEPVFGRDKVAGRGACDAKGQWISMYAACKELERRGQDGFALLLVSGEEVGSVGAKAFSGSLKAPLLVIGEPTDNIPVSAAKGTKSYDLRFVGEPFHSGYPDKGRSAVEMFMDFMIGLEIEAEFPVDRVLGETTWNVGMLRSDNPKNVLSSELTCQLYFRTTFASDEAVVDWMRARRSGTLQVTEIGGDAPARYLTLPGFPTAPVAFGSDAPHLTNFERKIICGPGSIAVAHRDDEYLSFADLEQAINQYVSIYESCH